jgi:hypothetical protein
MVCSDEETPVTKQQETSRRFYNTQHQCYCGIDRHARAMHVCILKQSGEILVHRLERQEKSSAEPTAAHYERQCRGVAAPHDKRPRRPEVATTPCWVDGRERARASLPRASRAAGRASAPCGLGGAASAHAWPWPVHVAPVLLPPYSPALPPLERLRRDHKARFADHGIKTLDGGSETVGPRLPSYAWAALPAWTGFAYLVQAMIKALAPVHGSSARDRLGVRVRPPCGCGLLTVADLVSILSWDSSGLAMHSLCQPNTPINQSGTRPCQRDRWLEPCH